MNSPKKSTGHPGFDIDPETGKYVPVPVNFSALFTGSVKKRQNQNWNNPKNDGNPGQPAKFRKTESGVRKELFKPPIRNNHRSEEPLKDIKNRGPVVRKSLLKSLPSKNDPKAPVPKIPSEVKSSMKSITEEVEPQLETMKKQAYPFKSPMTPQVKFSSNLNEDEVKTPESFDSNENFLGLEKLCQSSMDTNESPVSSVCNLFGSHMLINSEKKCTKNNSLGQKKIIAELKRTVLRHQEIFEETSMKIKEITELHTKHEENLRKMMTLIDKLDDSDGAETSSNSDNAEDKENSAVKRRSLRLQNKSPSKNGACVSPVILKAGDLRKSTLTKSLVSKCQEYQIDSPRIQRAIDMYNSSRNECRALLTPKISRCELNKSPITSNWRNNLSQKVQKQCLLLQDTPVHKVPNNK